MAGKPSVSPTQRTLQWLRKNGYAAGVVEKWIPHIKRRVDLFGAIDIIAVRASPPETVGIQCTSKSNMSSRVKKALSIPEISIWKDAGNQMLVVGWSKEVVGKRSLWVPTVKTI